MGKFVLKNFVIHGVLIDVSKLYTYSAKSLCNGKVSEMGDGAGNLGLHHQPHHRSVSSSNPSLLCGPLSLRLSLSSRSRGLAAARDLSQGELILTVPKSALMTSQSLLKDEKLSVAVKRHTSLSSPQILTICLLAEMSKGKSSWWHPYLMQLPRSYDTLANFSQFEKQALQVDDAIWVTERAILKAELEWKKAIPLMEELKLKPQLQNFRAWLWASSTVSSRTMHIPWDDAGCLCPVGDFYNYAAPGEEPCGWEDLKGSRNESSLQDSSFWNKDATSNSDAEQDDVLSQRLTDGGYKEDLAAYCFYARKNYKKGEQVLLSYGTYTNLELLEHYGFLLDENPNDKAFIPLEPEVYASSSWPKDSLYIHQNGKPSFALLSALRLWATPASQRRSVGHLVYSGTQLSSENEIFVMEWIAKSCHVVLENLPTSVEEDSLLLCALDKMQDPDLPMEVGNALRSSGVEFSAFLEAHDLKIGDGNVGLLLSEKARRSMERWKLAVQWRLRHKRILVDCISRCTEIISSLSPTFLGHRGYQS